MNLKNFNGKPSNFEKVNLEDEAFPLSTNIGPEYDSLNLYYAAINCRQNGA